LVPTACTPNGDNAHDTWELINLDEAYPDNVVRVYNRWGNILFESIPGDYNANVWDGTYKGEVLPVGSYYFIIELNNDEQESITGTVTIILE
jgi:gliding motility-associated-like protein